MNSISEFSFKKSLHPADISHNKEKRFVEGLSVLFVSVQIHVQTTLCDVSAKTYEIFKSIIQN